jgi:hypothetical protein
VKNFPLQQINNPSQLQLLFFPLHAYRIHLKGLTGTAGKISSISQPGNDFSTKDADNDKCICKCSQMLTGGRWCSFFLFVLASSGFTVWEAGNLDLKLTDDSVQNLINTQISLTQVNLLFPFLTWGWSENMN